MHTFLSPACLQTSLLFVGSLLLQAAFLGLLALRGWPIHTRLTRLSGFVWDADRLDKQGFREVIRQAATLDELYRVSFK